jgi:hypothetical protein
MSEHPADAQFLQFHHRFPQNGVHEKDVSYAVALEHFGDEPGAGYVTGIDGIGHFVPEERPRFRYDLQKTQVYSTSGAPGR